MNPSEIFKTTRNTWNKVAKQYQSQFMDVRDYDDSYDAFCQLIKMKNAHLLEIGCGPGNITRYLLDRKKKNFQIDAIDYTQNMVQLAKKNCPEASISLMDCRKIGELKKTYNGIISGFCIPYLSNKETKQLIGNVYTLLEEKGIFYLSFIEGDYASSGFEKDSNDNDCYTYYYDKNDILDLLTSTGFIFRDLIQEDHIKANGEMQKLSILIVSKS